MRTDLKTQKRGRFYNNTPLWGHYETSLRRGYYGKLVIIVTTCLEAAKRVLNDHFNFPSTDDQMPTLSLYSF